MNLEQELGAKKMEMRRTKEADDEKMKETEDKGKTVNLPTETLVNHISPEFQVFLMEQSTHKIIYIVVLKLMRFTCSMSDVSFHVIHTFFCIIFAVL